MCVPRHHPYIHVYKSELRAARCSNMNTAPKTNEKKTDDYENLSVQNLEKKPRARTHTHTHQTREKLRCEPTHRLKMGERGEQHTRVAAQRVKKIHSQDSKGV